MTLATPKFRFRRRPPCRAIAVHTAGAAAFFSLLVLAVCLFASTSSSAFVVPPTELTRAFRPIAPPRCYDGCIGSTAGIIDGGSRDEGFRVRCPRPTRPLDRRRRHRTGFGFAAPSNARSITRLLDAASSATDADEKESVVDRLDLTDQFERWRFLQDLLDDEADPSDVNEVLYVVLKSFVEGGPSQRRRAGSEDEDSTEKMEGDDEDDGGDVDVDDGSSSASPVLTEAKRSIIEPLLLHHASAEEEYRDDDGDDDDVVQWWRGTVPAFSLLGSSSTVAPRQHDIEIIRALERLLPTMDDDEDAYKGLWDIVCDLHGRESVRVRQEREGTDDDDGGWHARCTVAKLLVHHDFLTKGISMPGRRDDDAHAS